jgi:hypothetical protein
MSNSLRIRVAAIATALFVAALSAAGLAVRDSHQPHTSAAAPVVAPQPAQRGVMESSDGQAVSTPYEAEDDGEGWEGDDD